MKTSIGLIASFVLFAGVVFGMTEDEFAQAVAAAEDGGTVEITSDFTFTKSITVDKNLTITSGEGGPYVLSRDVNYREGTIFTVNGSGISVELTNLTVTGQKELNPPRTSSSAILVKKGKLTFGNGFTIKDFNIGINGGIAIQGSSSKLYMKDGALISGFECWSYGTAIIIGTGGQNTGWFFMEGGEISGCAGHSPHANDPEWDGVVYLYGGKMSATGGRIINNTSDVCVAGINAYTGDFYFGGNFVCTNNIGVLANDYFRNNKESNISGFYFVTTNYTGMMTVKARTDPTHGTAWTAQSWTKIWDESAQGYPDQARSLGLGWEGVSYETDPELILSLDPPQGNWYGVWRNRAYDIYDADGAWMKSNWKDLEPKAITNVPAGGTLELHKNWNLTDALTISNSLTMTSYDPENPCVILHKDNSAVNLLAARHGAEILLKDIILDGGGETRSFGNGCSACSVRSGAVVTLGKGTVIRNAVAATYGSALIIYDENSKAIMEDGALITDCTATAGAAYGSVVIIGTSTTIEGQGPVFEMRGGLITRCSCPGRTKPDGGYSGIVYAYNSALFDMSGGAITGNTSDACPGVVAYCGKVRISGRATIKDNVGPYPGIWMNNGTNESLRFYGNFNGYVQISSGTATAGSAIYKVNRLDAETNVNGARCIHSVDNTLVGKWDGSQVVWAPHPAAKLILK